MVPEGWHKKIIGDISLVSSGGTPSRKNNTYWDGSIPWVTTAEVDFCNILDSKEKITELGLKESSAKLYPVGTILIAMYGQGKTRGKVAKLGVEASTNQACAAIQLKADYEVDFYYQYLQSQYDTIRKLSNSGGQKNLSGAIIKLIAVPVPPLSEQKRITKILSTWDKAITITEQLLANSQHHKLALMQKLLTGSLRFAELSGAWEKTSLSEVVKISKGRALSSKDLNPGNYPVIAGGKSSPYTHASHTHENAITVSASGAYAGYVAFHKQKIWASDCSVIQSLKNSDIQFIFQYLLLNQKKIYSLQSGGAQPHIYPKDLGSLKIKIPEFSEQKKIASVLSSADQEIEVLRQKLAYFKQEKKALMQQLLTGKRRVRL